MADLIKSKLAINIICVFYGECESKNDIGRCLVWEKMAIEDRHNTEVLRSDSLSEYYRTGNTMAIIWSVVLRPQQFKG